ncbi:hypothetical protein GALMADRAFT_224674 [Galerina marginata CBS 339.88]|uniref:Uncharacterized protein n=1 Tax=Galerina marginata (strain CBS 339.88) TaxID=685588 RepID=A0A067TEH4_GALM3|nr:hypothetical protein GALMADRAFT_224674 [Galerina marginata CBS 339.88]
MDLSAVNWNITIDDFDSLLTYDDQSVWTTPDPSVAGFDPTNSPWSRGTYHQTTTKGASVSLNITGPAVYIYGDTGPSCGSFEVKIDSVVLQYSAYRESSNNSSTLLFAASNLTYANHNIVLRNLGALPEAGDKGGDAFTLDYIHSTIQLAPAGATVKNVTYEEHDPAITFSGTWGNNSSPAFSGGTTTFTNQDNASFSFSFHGSAVYVLGDKKNDHRLYSVVLDNLPAVSYNGISGCGGAFGLTCEQQAPSIKYLASNLDDSLHKITLVNHANVNASFFDLDSIVVAVPSQYGPRQLSTGSSPFTTSSTSGTPTLPPTATRTGTSSSSDSGSSQTSAGHVLVETILNPLLLLTFAVLYFVRPTLR